MKIEVTQEDIDEGRHESCTHCPVAKALARALVDATVVLVTGTYARWTRHGVDYVADLPRVAAIFICHFDYGRSVEPFEFELEGLPSV